MLVLNITDDFLYEVLHRNQACSTTVLICHQYHLHMTLLHQTQCLRHRHSLRNNDNRTHQATQVKGSLPRLKLQQITHMQRTHNLVLILHAERIACMMTAAYNSHIFCQRIIQKQAYHILSWHHDLARYTVGKVKNIADHAALDMVNLAVALAGAHQLAQLVLTAGAALLVPGACLQVMPGKRQSVPEINQFLKKIDKSSLLVAKLLQGFILVTPVSLNLNP